MKDEGKTITSRELIVEDGNLNGKIVFSFDDIELVEGIVYEEPFYYLTIPPEDSIISTNGEIVISVEHKRIIWDSSMEVLKFKMFSDEVESQNLVGMAEYYDPE
jgi:predicted metal-dependent TIM-barrel fold hydrolase